MNARFQDSPAGVFLRLLADLMAANLLMILCSLPLVTIGASLSAMYSVMFHRERDEGMVAVLRTFFVSFKRNFLKATALEFIVLVIFGACLSDFTFAMSTEPPIRSLYVVVGTIIAVIGLILFILAFAQQAVFDNSIANYLKNSFALVACAPLEFLGAAASWILPWYLIYLEPEVFVQFGVIYMLWGFSFSAWLTAKLMTKVFRRFQPEDSSF